MQYERTYILCETSLVLKKDKCLSVENILVKVWQSHFKEIIELISSIIRNFLIKRLFNFHAVFSNSARKRYVVEGKLLSQNWQVKSFYYEILRHQ